VTNRVKMSAFVSESFLMLGSFRCSEIWLVPATCAAPMGFGHGVTINVEHRRNLWKLTAFKS